MRVGWMKLRVIQKWKKRWTDLLLQVSPTSPFISWRQVIIWKAGKRLCKVCKWRLQERCASLWNNGETDAEFSPMYKATGAVACLWLICKEQPFCALSVHWTARLVFTSKKDMHRPQTVENLKLSQYPNIHWNVRNFGAKLRKTGLWSIIFNLERFKIWILEIKYCNNYKGESVALHIPCKVR